ncbi:MAG TPA: sensor histidine kinase [Candidatus Copromorpha excrementigallinarum]|uniref:Sensor histidine kinase n=1 Tax=Candidatus Allocopromorpha excrementigallinarum TaxID=2840742 RepID=A0A9D1I2D9_9FIRM|nr:sensor histidine kinase [Candidatus Copromorpha excrementigallinarum]
MTGTTPQLLIIAAFNGLLLSGIVKSLIPIRKKWWAWALLFSVCYFSVTMIIYIGDWINLVPTVLVFTAGTLICGEGIFLEKLAVSFMTASTLFSVSAICDNYVGLYIPFPYRSLVKTAFLLALFLLARRFAPSKGYRLSPSMWRLLLLLSAAPFATVISVVVIASDFYIDDMHRETCLALLIIALASFLGLLWTTVVLGRQRELELEALFGEMNDRYYRLMEQQSFEIRRLKHDMANHLQAMAAMGEKRGQYIEELLQKEAFRKVFTWSGDDTVNAVMTVKSSVMERDSIKMKASVEIDRELPFKKTDVCAIFANALDNAIEACRQLEPEDRKIILESGTGKGLFVLSVKNPVPPSGEGRKGAGLPATAKEDGRNHGFGLRSIKETAERNGGSMEIKSRDGRFCLLVHMPLPRDDKNVV